MTVRECEMLVEKKALSCGRQERMWSVSSTTREDITPVSGIGIKQDASDGESADGSSMASIGSRHSGARGSSGSRNGRCNWSS